MSLLVCRRCTTRYALGLARCPNCTATGHFVQGEEVPMAKIHAGREPTYAPATALGELAHRAPGPAPTPSPAPGPDLGPESLVPAMNYGARTVVELRQLLRQRNETRHEAEQLPLSGNKADLVARLQTDDERLAG